MAAMEEGLRLLARLLLVLTLLPLYDVTKAIDSSALETIANDLPQVRWMVGTYSNCTVDCGRGRQTRSVRCVKDVHWQGRTMQAKVSDSMCPAPKPDRTRPCNTHPCVYTWAKGNWSECSVTCGLGTQSREVRCESSSWSGERYQVSPADCPQLAPLDSRPCHNVDCYFGEGVETGIKSEDYTLIQFRRAKKLKVNVGGVVNLLPRQTVLVKCPVSEADRSLVYWSKGYRLISSFGRVKFNHKGNLKIRKADPKTDAGVYTCVLGDQQANVEVKFVKKGDPTIKAYRYWIKKSFQQHRHNLKRFRNLDTTRPGRPNNVISRPRNNRDGRPAELRQRDQISTNRTRGYQLSYVTDKWSACSATCRAPGHRKRKVTCSHVTPKYVKLVSDEECKEARLVKPVALEECSRECPQAVWVPGRWGQCRTHCGAEPGFKARSLSCVWAQSRQPAYHACDRTRKPVTQKPCKTKPCPAKCKDKSRHCRKVRLLNLCRFPGFRRVCCGTCQVNRSYNSTPT